MKRALTIALLGGLVALLAPTGASAGGGGGCYEPATDERGHEVKLTYTCFSPTVLRIKTGDEVTFKAVKKSFHSLTGANQTWGNFRELTKGDTRTYAFEKSGVYPYYCAYHAGMVGTIVVGNGKGPGPTAKGKEVRRIKSEPVSFTVPADPSGNADVVPLIVIASGLLIIGLTGTTLFVRAQRRRGPGSI